MLLSLMSFKFHRAVLALHLQCGEGLSTLPLQPGLSIAEGLSRIPHLPGPQGELERGDGLRTVKVFLGIFNT